MPREGAPDGAVLPVRLIESNPNRTHAMNEFTRRKFLQQSALAAGGLLLPFAPVFAAKARELDARRLRKFVDELPRPRRVSGPTLDLSVTEFKQQLHADLPPTVLWG